MPRIRPPGFESWLDLLQAWTHYFVSVSQFPMCQAGLIVPTPPPRCGVQYVFRALRTALAHNKCAV